MVTPSTTQLEEQAKSALRSAWWPQFKFPHRALMQPLHQELPFFSRPLRVVTCLKIATGQPAPPCCLVMRSEAVPAFCASLLGHAANVASVKSWPVSILTTLIL